MAATKSKAIDACYSRRRHEVYVLNHEGVQIFSIQDEQLNGVSQKTLENEDALLDWVLNNYAEPIEALLP